MTKKQRNNIYKNVYERIGYGSAKYVCISLDSITQYRYHTETLLDIFEEFKLLKPNNVALNESWFEYNDSGRLARLNALAFCIAMTE